MSRLTDYRVKPPEVVEIDGAEYMLNGCFRNCILTLEALLDTDLMDWEKVELVMDNMYAEPHPENTAEAVRLALDYLMQGREVRDEDKNRPAVIDFRQDGQLIYDAFLLKGIDLDKSGMTFWEFLAHLRELPEGCTLSRYAYWRQTPMGKLTKGERDLINKIGHDEVFLKKAGATDDLFR